MVQAEGLETVFKCLHPGERLYFWIVNGIRGTSSEFPPVTVVTVSGGTGGDPSVLTILPALPQYNNIIVQCGVFLLPGGEMLSRNSTLVVG